MGTNFPTALDTVTNPSVQPGQTGFNAVDALVALQAKVGINSSAVTSSLDYKVAHPSGGGAVGAGNPGANTPLYQAWNFDPLLLINSSDATNPGQMYTATMVVPAAMTVTNIYMNMVTSNAAMGLLYAAIYTSAGVLVVQSSDTGAAYRNGANAYKAIPFPVASTSLAAGLYILGFWGTTIDPLFWRGTGNADINAGCSSPIFRAGVGATGLTVTAPGTLGTITAQAQPFWFAIG